jgi:anaerobic selenocysteine-containing dehydrogenase
VLEERGTPVEAVRALFVMNREDGGFDCPGCAWPDDPSGLRLDICENGVKHVTWELTRKQAGRDFFAAHAVSELAGWSDYDLEAAGRLSEPVHYDPGSDRYVPISWEGAFELVGDALRGLDSPHRAHRQKALEDGDLRRYAAQLGLDLATFDRDRTGGIVLKRIQRDVDSGLASGQVLGTPTLFIDGVVYRRSYDPPTLLVALAPSS